MPQGNKRIGVKGGSSDLPFLLPKLRGLTKPFVCIILYIPTQTTNQIGETKMKRVKGPIGTSITVTGCVADEDERNCPAAEVEEETGYSVCKADVQDRAIPTDGSCPAWCPARAGIRINFLRN